MVRKGAGRVRMRYIKEDFISQQAGTSIEKIVDASREVATGPKSDKDNGGVRGEQYLWYRFTSTVVERS